MKFETVKSFILTILVGLSLLLTFGLWSYQPNLDTVNPNNYVDQAHLGGAVETKKDLIEPTSVIFQSNSNYYGFTDPRDRVSLYHEVQKWDLHDFKTEIANGKPTNDEQIEFIFPEALSMEEASSLFRFSDNDYMPEWRFDRVYITFNRNASTLNVKFLSLDGQQQATAIVNDSDEFDQLWKRLTTYDGLSEYIMVKSGASPIYIPKNKVDMVSRSLIIRTIDSSLLVDALFKNPDIVSRNPVGPNEVYFTDDQRGMRVYMERPSIVYQNPYQSTQNNQSMTPSELIDLSRLSINEHKGWTDEYNLMDIDSSTNTIRYQMYYDGYPVYSGINLSIIEQEWHTLERSQELTEYIRPLFRLSSLLDGDSVVLRSGEDVAIILENNRTYNMKGVTDIKIGYRLAYKENTLENSIIYELQPAWYMKYNGQWMDIPLDELTQKKGGS